MSLTKRYLLGAQNCEGPNDITNFQMLGRIQEPGFLTHLRSPIEITSLGVCNLELESVY